MRRPSGAVGSSMPGVAVGSHVSQQENQYAARLSVSRTRVRASNLPARDDLHQGKAGGVVPPAHRSLVHLSYSSPAARFRRSSSRRLFPRARFSQAGSKNFCFPFGMNVSPHPQGHTRHRRQS